MWGSLESEKNSSNRSVVTSTCLVVSRCAEAPRIGQLALTVSQVPVVAVGFRQLLDPSMPSWSTHGVQVMSRQAYLPKDSSQAPPSKQDVQLEEVEDPALEYGRSAAQMLQTVTLPVAPL
jgi:hypothetical protein